MARKCTDASNQHDTEKMPLLLATVYESARLMPSGPLLQRCSLKHGPVEELINQRRGSFVLNNPNENPAFLPFGSGTRACVCQKFVARGIATLLASLLEQYELFDGEDISSSFSSEIVGEALFTAPQASERKDGVT
ncbi:Cytochrome P450 [Corchorus olitorius]|uniref:Cytochrome P450 n=1 Tax=Corchorus olitorius TaxID=93759 RepID=A0A1R3IU21_9ROSI|nr:Cytochrome P450 [Corchorus olitorius]